MDWEDLVAEYQAIVVRVCWRILGHRADVEDCTQETFLKAIEYSREVTVRNWPGLLRRIAVMSALARLRSRGDMISLDADSVQSDDEAADEFAIRSELEMRLRHAVGELPSREGAVFCLRYFEGLSHGEIATALDIRSGAVATALHRARRKLQPLFADLLTGADR